MISNKLPQKITVGGILKFTLPTTIMMIFMSLYQNVDGIFIANLVGDMALSATNIVFPALCIFLGIAIMIATGANAIIARNIGRGMVEEAKKQFTFVVIVGVVLGFIVAILGLFLARPISELLGATDLQIEYCADYLFIIMLGSPFLVLQILFQSFFVTAGKPNIGLIAVTAGGICNIVLDYVFIAPCNMGIKGAALATIIGYSVPAIVGLIYFSVKRNGTLFFVKPHFDFKMLGKACFNGSSEMVTNVAMAVTTMLFNFAMLKYLGEAGVAAVTIAMFLQYFLSSVYMGFSMGVSSVFSYNYGREDEAALKKLMKISVGFIIINSVVWYLVGILLKRQLIGIFAAYGSEVYNIASDGWWFFSVTFLLSGFNIFASALFTAFSDGKTSAIISFLRTFVFLVVCILVLPIFWQVKGIWLAVPVAEALSLIVSIAFVVYKRKRFKYA